MSSMRALDPQRPATTSPIVVQEVMRGEIGFDGLIMSDDVSMKALGGPYEERAAAIFDAGLDIVLHCNGELEEARAVASASPPLSGAIAAPRRSGARRDRSRPSRSTSRRRAEFAAIKAELGAA